MTFENPVTIKITSTVIETGNNITFDGISIQATTPENAATQINKIFSVASQTVTPQGMKRTIIQEAQE